MKEKNNQPLDISQIEASLRSIQLEPGREYQMRMASAPWRQSTKKQREHRIFNQRIVFSSMSVFILLVITMMFTNIGKTLAQTIQQFFIQISGDSVPLPEEMVIKPMPSPTAVPTYWATLKPENQVAAIEPTATSIPTPIPNTHCAAEDYVCQLDEATTIAGFTPWQLPAAPEGLSFDHMEYRPGTTIIQYGHGIDQLTIEQSTQSFTDREDTQEENIWVSVPSNSIQNVEVDGMPAEYVKGQFMIYVGETMAQWDADLPVERLRWQNGSWWFEIVWISATTMGSQSMTDLAAQLSDDSSRVQVEAQFTLPSENYESVVYTDIQKLKEDANFDILEPGLLPEELPFSHARFTSDSKGVMLYYGKFAPDKIHLDGPVLIIGEGLLQEEGITAGESYPPEAIQPVEVNGYQGLFIFGMMETGQYQPDQPAPTPVWNPNSNALMLWWSTETMTYSIHFNNPFAEDGLRVTQQTLLQIADSLN